MGGDDRDGDQRLHSAQAWCQREQLQGFGEAAGILARAVDLKAQHATPSAHLLHGKRALRMAFEEGIAHAPHLGMIFQELRDSKSILILSLYPYGEGLNSPQQEPGGVRIHVAAKRGSGGMDVLDQVAAACEDSANQVRVPSEILGT